MLTLTNRIDMRPGAVPLVIHLGQYDSDFSLVFELYSSAGNFTVESGTTAMIRGTKTDGHAYDADATIDVSAKTVTVAGSEQMTAAKGRNVYELVLKKGTKVLSTANFILNVERAAMDADTIASESVLKELNAIIDSAATSTQAAADAASAADRAEDAAESVSSASTQIATNTADIADLKADFEQFVPGLTDEAKQALLACFQHVIWLDHDADYYQRLNDALYASQDVVFISAVFDSGSVVLYPDTSLDDLKAFLTVTATYTDSHSSEVMTYALSGSLVVGVNTITVSYQNKTTTFTVTISDYEWGSDYTWLYRPSVDGLLSQNENVSSVAAIGGQTYATETLDGDILNLSAEYNGNNYGSIFKFIPLTPSSASLKAKVKFNALPIASPGGGLRMQVSNGTNGAQLFVSRYSNEPNQPKISTFEGSTSMELSNIELEQWYVITCELSGDTQIIKVDDVTYNPSALSSYANTETRLIVLEPDNTVSSTPGDLDFDIAWIAFKDNSN